MCGSPRRVTGIARTTVQRALERTKAAKLVWPLGDEVSDEVLEERLYGGSGKSTGFGSGVRNHPAWNKVISILDAEGYAVLTLDLPGAGANTIAPKSLAARPFDLATFAAEPSAIAGVTLDERTQAVVALVRLNPCRACHSRA